ncbi:3-phosphoserine/phosphohydroxythreonine transaminase [Thalassotalea sp. PS06]|uniref:3-phosphoserine/phosphohydroxythreonine transaminase n=1 Tax=Thalassotalea sp. PS06 TaxID=2594005 RepID=UPI0011638AC1|nr:3-phosphoserine/phosphohydroxythreonine transaminase [Thalassotalea sp. PS06]QDP01117.1 3-phosphoserine/phosphohydroxythreonine transaminase [Thalassotalea sp. PS06]
MKQIFNFCAGPAMLPKPVMEQAQQEFLNWNDTGCSVMELSHRGPEFMALAAKAEQDLRDILNIPDNYKVLFCHGGGRGQFSAVPQNLLTKTGKADYVVTGSWSKSAVAEAKNYGEIRVIEPVVDVIGKKQVLPASEWGISEGADYVHYCPNETVDGIEIFEIPETGNVPLVADMSSTILSRPIDVSKFGLIYAGAQKNIGPSGLTIVIVRDDLLGRAMKSVPGIFNYQTLADNDSMYNTPPTYAWYLASMVFSWLKELGGLEQMAKKNRTKADFLYQYIEQSGFYESRVSEQNRSMMNVPFYLKDESLNSEFLAQAKDAGLLALKGHRSVGGMRASIYNAMPLEGVEALVAFMQQFAETHNQ